MGQPDYAFVGWTTSPDGTGTLYADGAIYDFSADITLYAKWELVHTVIFYEILGDWSSSRSQGEHAPTVLESNVFTFSGHDFTGWNTEADGSGTAYADGANYDFSADLNL